MRNRRKVWYIYKNGYNVGQRWSRQGALSACELEAGRLIESHSVSKRVRDVFEKDRILINNVEAKLEDIKL